MAPALIHPVIADQGAAFKLELIYEDTEGILTDLSIGWAARLIIKETIDAVVDIIDVTDSGAEITLGDGTATTNINILVGAAATTLWPVLRAGKYELHLWQTATPEDISILLKGDIEIRKGMV